MFRSVSKFINPRVASRCFFSSPSAVGKGAGAAAPQANAAAVAAVVEAPKDKKNLPVSFQDITLAAYRIKSGLKYTHCDKSQFLSELCNTEVWMKKDFTQFTGSFKERGGRNALMLLTQAQKDKGVVTASAGNHALALAWHGKDLGIPVTCVMPTSAPMAKVDKCRKFGANVILHGEHIGEAKTYAQETYPDVKYINGYDDPEIIAGAGSMGLEIMEQVKDVDVVLVPIGGAGLIAGVSLACKTINPNVQVIGVEPANVASYAAAIKAGKPVNGFLEATIADGLAVPIVGPTSFEVARHYVDSSCVVSEKLIAIAMLRLIEMEKLVVEGGGAAALAAILPDGPLFNKFAGKKVCVLLCGGNIDTSTLGRVIDRGLAADRRLVRFGATVSDRPGGIARLATDMAAMGASVKDIHHERAWLYSRVDQVVVKCVVETTGADHADKIFKGLRDKGYPLTVED
ncbi:tryptophan synthase beta subunit-like PLP-dependent enzyme [Ochromonadaceae sp. CCMP2298]|nr:tryptophan synthase beta subunit-like PLP-dependent enzyme [Ochromonadaceae sp. CCMP2298]